MPDCNITRDWESDRLVLRLDGVFDRATAWNLRDRVERETAAEILVDFSLVRDFSDLAVAVLAHGLQMSQRRVMFRGLRQHQLRIFRYCGVPVEELTARDAVASRPPAAAQRGSAPAGPPPEKRA
jgi:anti-anti-sigma regulatory factor